MEVKEGDILVATGDSTRTPFGGDVSPLIAGATYRVRAVDMDADVENEIFVSVENVETGKIHEGASGYPCISIRRFRKPEPIEV
jgi:hypothetical protein